MGKLNYSINIQFLFLSTIILLPVLLTLGIAVAEIFLFFLTIYGTYKIVLEKKFYLIRSKEIIFLFIFLKNIIMIIEELLNFYIYFLLFYLQIVYFSFFRVKIYWVMK